MQAASFQVAQARPANTTAATAFTATIETEITKIFVCNTTASAVDFSVFHDDDGSTYDETTALYFDTSVPANETFLIEAQADNMLSVDIDGTIGIKTSVANALNFTLYGITTTERGQ